MISQEQAFRDGYLAGSVHAPVDLAWAEWRRRLRVDERDCDTCQFDGECYSTVLKCRGHKKREGV